MVEDTQKVTLAQLIQEWLNGPAKAEFGERWKVAVAISSIDSFILTMSNQDERHDPWCEFPINDNEIFYSERGAEWSHTGSLVASDPEFFDKLAILMREIEWESLTLEQQAAKKEEYKKEPPKKVKSKKS